MSETQSTRHIQLLITDYRTPDEERELQLLAHLSREDAAR